MTSTAVISLAALQRRLAVHSQNIQITIHNDTFESYLKFTILPWTGRKRQFGHHLWEACCPLVFASLRRMNEFKTKLQDFHSPFEKYAVLKHFKNSNNVHIYWKVHTNLGSTIQRFQRILSSKFVQYMAALCTTSANHREPDLRNEYVTMRYCVMYHFCKFKLYYVFSKNGV